MSARAILTLIVLALMLAIGGGAAWQQKRIGDAQAAIAKANAALLDMQGQRDTARQERDAALSNVHIVTEYVDRVQIVREAAKVITREVPVYVTPKADAACPVPAGFVRIHDAAAGNRAPETGAGDPDAPAPGITLSGIADTVADNYATYHLLAEQVTALQAYIRAQCDAPQESP